MTRDEVIARVATLYVNEMDEPRSKRERSYRRGVLDAAKGLAVKFFDAAREAAAESPAGAEAVAEACGLRAEVYAHPAGFLARLVAAPKEGTCRLDSKGFGEPVCAVHDADDPPSGPCRYNAIAAPKEGE